jgi:hypothetical protein
VRGVAVFDRDPATGEVHQRSGRAGCLAAAAAQGCRPLRADFGTIWIAFLRGGRRAAVVTQTLLCGSNDCEARFGVALLQRTPDTGAVSQDPGRGGCLEAWFPEGDGCTAWDRPALELLSATLGPGRERVYLVNNAGVQLVLGPADRGLRPRRRPADCLDQYLPTSECRRTRTSPSELAVARDTATAYLVGDPMLVAARLDPTTGELVPLQRRAACLAPAPAHIKRCAPLRGLQHPPKPTAVRRGRPRRLRHRR